LWLTPLYIDLLSGKFNKKSRHLATGSDVGGETGTDLGKFVMKVISAVNKTAARRITASAAAGRSCCCCSRAA
jgi:hypothetical protein